ncbi:MAG: hypothetical protein RLZZ171_3032, partial [Cyanobacteriota bacterium]
MSFQEEIVRIRLDSKAFEKELAALKNKPEVSELKVKAKLVKTSVTALIRSFETLKASVKVQAKIANLKTLQTSLDAFDGKITVDAIVNFTKAIAQIEKFKTTKAVYIAAKLAPDSITTFQNDVQELTKLVFKTVRLVEFKDVDSDVAAQIQKTIAKVQKGLARKIPVTLETTGKYVAELQSALASLKNTDNIDLFNGAIEQLETIKTKLKAIENHSIDLQEIPAKRVKKDNPNGLDAATVHVQAPHGGQPDAFRVSVAVKPTLDPQSLSAVLDEIESYSPTVQVGVELDPKKVAALSETPLPKLDPVPVSIDPALNETKSTEAIAKLKTNVEAVIAELKTYIANGLSSAVQEGLKRRVSEDAAKLSVDIERVNVDNLATSVSNAVVDGLKEISAADLKQLKQKIGTAKGIATQAEKPEVKPEYVKSVLKQIEKLQAAKALLSGTGNEATEQDLDATLSRLIAALTKLGGSLGEAQFDLDNTEIKNTLNAIEQKVNSSQDPKSAKIPDQPPQTVDLYKNMGMDATPEIQNLVTQIARLVAVNKGLGDVWQDSMAPPVFTQGYHLEPLARGAAFKDGSGLVLRSDVAEFLTGTEGAFKDSFETVVHEIVHVMQRLSKDLGRDIEYDTQPQNERERRSIQITESNPFYQAENKLTGGQTFKNEHMANLTAYRESAQIAHELGIKLYSAIDPAKKLAAKLTAFNTALNNAPKIVQRVTEVQGAVAGAVAQAKAQEMADFQLGTTPDPYRSSSPQKVVKSTAEKLEAVTKSFFELEELFKKADADLKKAKRRDSNATKEDIEKLQRYRDYTEQRKTDVSRLRSELQQKLADDEKYLGNTVIATNRNRQEKTQADINVIATRNQVAKNLGAARVNTEDQRTRTARNRADAVTKVADATVNAKNSKTAQQELDAIQKREIELKLAGLKATKAQLLIDLQALRNTKQDASNQAQIVKDKNAI